MCKGVKGGGDEVPLHRLITFISSLPPYNSLSSSYNNKSAKHLNYFDTKIILLYIVAYELVDPITLNTISQLFKSNDFNVFLPNYVQGAPNKDKNTLSSNKQFTMKTIHEIILQILPLPIIEFEEFNANDYNYNESFALSAYLVKSSKIHSTDSQFIQSTKEYNIQKLLGVSNDNCIHFINNYFDVFNPITGKIADDISKTLDTLKKKQTKLKIRYQYSNEEAFYNNANDNEFYNAEFLKVCKLLINMTNASNKVLGVSGKVSGSLKKFL
jgi:hypothetical protein